MRGSKATSVDSVLDAKKKLQKFLRALDTIPQEEIDKEIPRIKAEAVAQTPYRTGKLEGSVYVRRSKDEKRKVGILAGASAISKGYDYAGIQHENEVFKHPVKGKAHFISDPFNDGVERLIRATNLRLKRARR